MVDIPKTNVELLILREFLLILVEHTSLLRPWEFYATSTVSFMSNSR